MNPWGKINNGQTYGLICDDVARRLATLKFGDYEGLLLNHIREHSWARSTRRKTRDGRWPSALPFLETMTAVAAAVCGPLADEKVFKHVRKKLYEAVAGLKADRILVEAGDEVGGLLINTNVDEWRVFTREFLPPYAAAQYALAARSGRDQDGPESAPKTAESEGPKISPGGDTRILPGGYAVSPGEDTPYPLERIRPYRGTGASEDLRRLNTDGEARPPVSDSSKDADPAADYPPGTDPRAPNALTSAERAELAAVAKLCEVYFPTRDDLWRAVQERRGAYPVHAYRAGVEALRDEPREKWGVKYLLAVVRSRAEAPPPRPAPGMPAAPAVATGPTPEQVERTRRHLERLAKFSGNGAGKEARP